ncbi:MAG: hypothetical protein C4327_04765 [Meiothermus sp.]
MHPLAPFTLGSGGRKRLIQRWNALMRSLGAPQEVQSGGLDDLLRRYGEPHRSYHNLYHLEALFQALEPHPVREKAALELAVWFHDAVYDPTRTDNEEESAALAVRSLAPMGLSPALVGRVVEVILATKTHRATDPSVALFLDADLSILGSDAKTYLRYARAIRQEHAWMPEELYRAGRARVLEGFLRRERIYQTEPFRRLEEAARQNLAEELVSQG